MTTINTNTGRHRRRLTAPALDSDPQRNDITPVGDSLRLSWFQAMCLRFVGNAISVFCKPSLFVLTYHRVMAQYDPLLGDEPDVKTFEWQMALLARCFNVMPLYDALRALDEGRLPPRTVCITFDDGYRSVHDLALPVLRKFNFPATVFITTGFMGNANNMWNDHIVHAVQSLPDGTLDLRDLGLEAYSLRTLDEREASVQRLTEAGKYLPPDERDNLIRRLDQLTGHSAAALMLSPEMLHVLQDNRVELGGHTISHPILTSLDEERARHEIAGGKRELEAMTGRPARLFAYPNGKAGHDFDERHVEMVRAAGFFAAFTTAIGAITAKQRRYELPRSRPWDRTPFRFGIRLLYWLARGNRQN